MSEQDNTIRALQIQCATNAQTIARLRAANKKLRAELVEERSNFDVLESGMRFEQAMATAYREAHKQLARQLAEAIGGNAK
jgi:hypothetical protein